MNTRSTPLMAFVMLAFSLNAVAQKENTAENNFVPSAAEAIALTWGAVYPVPVISTFTLSVNSSGETNAVLRLIDLLGRTAMERPVALAPGDNQFEVSMSDMAAGMYQLVLQTDSKRITYKLMKAQ